MGSIKIRALILDYGGVISTPQNDDNVKNMFKIIGGDETAFKDIYLKKRDDYDGGHLSGEEYWLSIFNHLGLEKNRSQISGLIQEDIYSWTHINESMIEFITESRKKCSKLAIISNMTVDTLAYMKKNFQWLAVFDEMVFSCDIGVNKPEQKIYETCLHKLNLPTQECLFVDDTLKNVEGAIRSGMQAIHFESSIQLQQLIKQNYMLSR